MLSHAGARQKAEDFLDAHGWIYKRPPVVNVETVGQVAGIHTSTIHDLKQACDTLGTGFRNLETGAYEILVDDFHYNDRYHTAQFTIAEEIGHYIVHRNIVDSFNSLEARIEYEEQLSQEEYQEFEGEAKAFGYALLLPQKDFDPFIKAWVGTNLQEVIGWGSYNEGDLAYEMATTVGRKLNVSVSAVRKALTRRAPNKLIAELVSMYKIPLQSNIPPNKITPKP